MRTILPLLVGAMLCVVGSAAGAKEMPVRGAVLGPGQTIDATNKFGSVRVSYVSPVKRKYEWDGQSRVVKMIVRPEPFLGELGLYDPADCFVVFLPLCQTPRLVLEEAFHDFDSYEQVYAFLRQGSAIMDWVYTSDGLVVGFRRVPQREQVSIDVRQITIRGRKPANLRGARNADIHLIVR